MKKDATLYLNLEEPIFSSAKNYEILDTVYELYRENIYPEGRAYLLLDEIQLIPNWERWVRARMEREDMRVVLTDSSSKLLSKELGTLLTGRHISFELFPLSFREFLRFKGLEITNRISLISQRRKIKNLIGEYIQFGGFPEVVLETTNEKKETILKHYFEVPRFFGKTREQLQYPRKIYTIDTGL